MKIKAKSIIIGRKKSKKDSDGRPCFISFFDTNDPHKKNIAPKEILDYNNIHKVILKNFEVNYLLEGNDLVINNLRNIEIKHDLIGHLIIKNQG